MTPSKIKLLLKIIYKIQDEILKRKIQEKLLIFGGPQKQNYFLKNYPINMRKFKEENFKKKLKFLEVLKNQIILRKIIQKNEGNLRKKISNIYQIWT